MNQRNLRHPPLPSLCGPALLAMFIATLAVGCGGDNLIAISGTVTFDGEPVERGTISFLPVDGLGPTAAAIITNGEYHTEVAPGEKRLEIHGYAKIGEQRPWGNDAPVEELFEEMLPPRYHDESMLRYDAQRSDATADFSLNSDDES